MVSLHFAQQLQQKLEDQLEDLRETIRFAKAAGMVVEQSCPVTELPNGNRHAFVKVEFKVRPGDIDVAQMVPSAEYPAGCGLAWRDKYGQKMAFSEDYLTDQDRAPRVEMRRTHILVGVKDL